MIQRWANDLSFSRKTLILIVLPLIVELMLLAPFMNVNSGRKELESWTAHSEKVLEKLQNFTLDLVEIKSGLGYFIFVEDIDFQNQLQINLIKIKNNLIEISNLVANQPEQLQAVLQLKSLLMDYEKNLFQLSPLLHQSRTREAFERVKQLSLTPLRNEVSKLIKFERVLARGRRTELLSFASQSTIIAAIGVGILVVLTIAIGHLFSVSVRTRFDFLLESIRKFSTGGQHVPILEGSDEIALLERAFYELSKSLAERSQENETFTYSVSHDMRSPLLNLHGFTQELVLNLKQIRDVVGKLEDDNQDKKMLVTLIDKDMPESMGFITSAVERLTNIINSLLTLSRVGRVYYNLQMVDLRPIIDRILISLQGSIRKVRAEVSVETLPQVYGDAVALEQVFANLLDNAIKYLDPKRPGRIILGVRWDLSSPDDYVFSVKDNGLGIPESFIPKVFLPFQRYHRSETKGEGMGLALVQRMVERHHGKLWVESQFGVETTFFLKLPALPNDRHNSSTLIAAAEMVDKTEP